MKLYSYFLFLVCVSETIHAQDLIEEQTNQSFLNAPFTLEFDDAEIADADGQIPPQALSEEDITTILFNELDFGCDQTPEEITHDEILLITNQDPATAIPAETIALLSELQEKNTPETKTPEKSFTIAMQDFISTKNIVSQETLSSGKMAKLQGKLIAEYIKQLSSTHNISIAQARNITRDLIQKKCQDLHLGISNVEKKSLKKLLQAL